jgi:thioredoxin-like negative regulator of GroEL
VALARVLERLEPEYIGRIKLVKLEAWAAENRELTERLGIKGVPTLLAFAGGEPVRRSVGNVPESQLRQFFNAVLAGPGDAQAIFRTALKALEEGDRSRGIAVLREALERNPDHVESRLTLLLELGRNEGPVDEQGLQELAEELWKLFPRFAVIARETYPDEIEAIQLRMSCLRDRPAMPAAPLLRERLETAPEDNWSRLTLARRRIAEGGFEEAAERLLQGVERGEAAAGFVFLRDFRSVHLLAGSWNEATGRQLERVLERVEASRKKKG